LNGLPHALAVVLLVTGLSSCSLLDLLFGVSPDPFPSFDPDDPLPFPTAEAIFSEGTATIELEGETIVLDEILDDSSYSELGYSVTWTNGEGWFLVLAGYGESMGFPDSGYLTLHRIEGDQHLMVLDPARCLLDTEGAEEDGVSGTATCRGLQWTDFFSSYSTFGFPKPVEGLDPFDAEITYEAR
jgi:hypothetical protein